MRRHTGESQPANPVTSPVTYRTLQTKGEDTTNIPADTRETHIKVERKDRGGWGGGAKREQARSGQRAREILRQHARHMHWRTSNAVPLGHDNVGLQNPRFSNSLW